VARATKEISGRSRLGAIAVNRVAVDSTGNRNGTYGLDGRIGLGEAITIDAWGAKTETPNTRTDEFAYSARAAYSTARWNNSVRLISVGQGFNPEVGFLNQPGGFRYIEVMAMRLVRDSNLKWLKDWNPHMSVRNYYRPDGYYLHGWFHMD